MSKVLIDLEFTGLDNDYIVDNEIVQVKLYNLDNNQHIIKNYKANKPPSNYNIIHGVSEFSGDDFFTLEDFVELLKQIGVEAEIEKIEPQPSMVELPTLIKLTIDAEFFGYDPRQDIIMLKKYNIEIPIFCMQEKIRLNPVYEEKMAKDLASMEGAYYLLTGKIPPLVNHYNNPENELSLLKEIYDVVVTFDEEKQSKVLNFMPWGFCAGMPITSYIVNYRKQADGYRYHNNDILSKSIDANIPDHVDYDEDDEDDNDWDEED